MGVDVEWDAAELALALEDFADKVIQPAVEKHGTELRDAMYEKEGQTLH